jgi:hypothetical protein
MASRGSSGKIPPELDRRWAMAARGRQNQVTTLSTEDVFRSAAGSHRAPRARAISCITDWRGDPDQLLASDPDTEVGLVLAVAAGAG